MFRWTVLLAAMIFCISVAVGCSGGGGSDSPISPTTLPEVTSGITNTGQAGTQNYLLGYYDVYFDVAGQNMEIVENRSASFTLNIVPFMYRVDKACIVMYIFSSRYARDLPLVVRKDGSS